MRENTPTSNVSGRRPRHPSGGMIAVNSWCPKVPVRPAREEPMEPAVIPRYAIQSEIQSIGRLAGRAGCLQALSTWSRPNRVDHRRHGAAPGGRRVGHGYVSGFVTFRTREGRRLPGLGSGALLTRRNGTSCTKHEFRSQEDCERGLRASPDRRHAGSRAKRCRETGTGTLTGFTDRSSSLCSQRDAEGCAGFRCCRSRTGRGQRGFLEHGQAAHHLLMEVIDLLVQVADLEFGFEVHLVLDVVAHTVAGNLTVLAEQHEHR